MTTIMISRKHIIYVIYKYNKNKNVGVAVALAEKLCTKLGGSVQITDSDLF